MSPTAILNDGINVMTPGGDTTDPFIQAIEPTTGNLTGGDFASITGEFSVTDLLSVTVGGVAGEFDTKGPNQARVIVPAGALGPADVVVTFRGGATSTIVGGYTYNDIPRPAPSIDSLTPNFGYVDVGTTHKLRGNLYGLTGLTINFMPISATPVGNVEADVFISGPGIINPGVYDIVAKFDGQPDVVVPGGFTLYAEPTVASVSPDTGDIAGGESVVITGTFSTEAEQVGFVPTFGASPISIPATIVSSDATTITVLTPATDQGVGLYAVDVRTEGSGGMRSAGVYTYTEGV